MDDQETVGDEVWARLAPLIPARPRRFRYPGRRPIDDRAALTGSCGCCATTCPGGQELHTRLLAECNAAGLLDLHRALVDSSHIHALKGGTRRVRARSTEPTPAANTT